MSRKPIESETRKSLGTDGVSIQTRQTRRGGKRVRPEPPTCAPQLTEAAWSLKAVCVCTRNNRHHSR